MKEIRDKQDLIKSKNKNGLILRIVLIIIVALVVILVSGTVISLFQEPTNIFVVEEGKLTLEETADAYIIRNEIVLKGENYKNGMEKTKAEGKKVAKGDTVFRYYVNGEDELKKKIDDLNNQILEAYGDEKVDYSAEVIAIKEQITTLLENMTHTNNVEEIERYKKEIDECNTKITRIIGENSKKGSYIRELIDEKEKYEKELNANAEIIKATESGIVSYKVDGYEETFKTDNFDYLSKEFLDGLDLKSGDMIDSSDEKGKIVTSFESYLAIVLSSESAKKAEVGDTVRIDIGEDNLVKAEIIEIKKEKDDSRLIVFKMIDLSENILDYRKITVDVIWWSYSGLKVPNSSIIKEGDYSYVIRSREGYDSKILVKVLQSNDSYSLVDNYSSKELSDMGYSTDEIRNMYTIKLYDRIKLNVNK